MLNLLRRILQAASDFRAAATAAERLELAEATSSLTQAHHQLTTAAQHALAEYSPALPYAAGMAEALRAGVERVAEARCQLVSLEPDHTQCLSPRPSTFPRAVHC